MVPICGTLCGTITCHPSLDCFPGLCSSTESHISMAKHINPGIFPLGNIIGKHVKGTRRKNLILLFIAPLKNYFALGRQFLLPHFASCLFEDKDSREMSSQGKGCKNGCKSIRMEEKRDLFSCALDPPAVCASAAHLLSPWVRGSK